jgi:GGDEF domain-containing protein
MENVPGQLVPDGVRAAREVQLAQASGVPLPASVMSPEESAQANVEADDPANLPSIDAEIARTQHPQGRAVLQEERARVAAASAPQAPESAQVEQTSAQVPQPAQPPRWEAVMQKPEFQALSSGDQERVREKYWDEIVVPRVPTDHILAYREAFDSDTKPSAFNTAIRALKAVMEPVFRAASGILDEGRKALLPTRSVMEGDGMDPSSTAEASPVAPISAAYYKRMARDYELMPDKERDGVLSTIDPENATPSGRAFLAIHAQKQAEAQGLAEHPQPLTAEQQLDYPAPPEKPKVKQETWSEKVARFRNAYPTADYDMIDRLAEREFRHERAGLRTTAPLEGEYQPSSYEIVQRMRTKAQIDAGHWLLPAITRGGAQQLAGVDDFIEKVIPALADQFLRKPMFGVGPAGLVGPAVTAATGKTAPPFKAATTPTGYLASLQYINPKSEVSSKPWDDLIGTDEHARWIGENLAEQAPQMVGFFSAALGPRIAAQLFLGGMGAMQAGQTFSTNLKAGNVDVQHNLADSFTQGGIEVLSELLPLGVFHKVQETIARLPVSARASFVGRVMKAAGVGAAGVAAQGGAEGLEEIVAQIGQNLSSKYIAGNDKVTWSDGVKEAGILGALGGVAMGAPHTVAAARAAAVSTGAPGAAPGREPLPVGTMPGERPAGEQFGTSPVAQPVGTAAAHLDAERRGDLARRKAITEMSPEEMRRELLVDPMTGLGNRRAYDESSKPAAHVAIDLDALKWINDNIGHTAGDDLIRAMGTAIRQEIGSGYHLSGDEFAIQAKSGEEARAAVQALQNRLGQAELTFRLPDGREITKKGVDFSHGIGSTLEEADTALRSHKGEREAAGQRARRGESPVGVTVRPAQGQQAGQDQAAAQAVGTSSATLTRQELKTTLNGDPDAGLRVRVVEGNRGVVGKTGELRTGGMIALPEGVVYAHGQAARFEVLPVSEQSSDRGRAIAETLGMPDTLGATFTRRAYSPAAEAEAAQNLDQARPDAIRRSIRELFNVPLNERGVTIRKAAGIYKTQAQAIRVRNQNDIDVITHEVGHHFSQTNQKVRDLMKQHQGELLAITPDAYAKESLALRREEGFAEFVRFYLTQKAEASRRAPGFMADFDAFVDRSKKYRPIFDQVQGQIDAWFKLDPVDRIMAKVGAEPRGLLDRLRENFGKDRLIFEALDNWHPLKRMVADLAPNIEAMKDPFKAAHLLSGDAAIIEDWLTSGTVPFDPTKRADPANYGKSLHEILKPVVKQLRPFSAYLIARRAQELKARGKENLFTDEEIKAGLALETPAFRAAAREVYAFNDRLIDYAVEGGLLSQEAADKFREYTAYIPFFRESEDGAGGRGKGGVFQRLRGGTSNLRDPISNLIQNTANIVHATNRNAVLAKAYQLAQTVPGGARWIESVPMPKKAVQVSTERILEQLQREGVKIDKAMAEDLATMQTFFQANTLGDDRQRITIVKINGEPKALQVNNKMLWQSLQAFEPVDLGFVGTMLAVPSDLLRAGVTLSPEFMARNFLRDTLSGYIQSKPGLIPGISTIGGFKEIATRSDAARLYRSFGGAYADMWKGDSEQTRRVLEKMAKRGKFDPRTILTPSGIIEILHRFGSVSEAGTRIAEFKKTAKKGDINSLIDAAYNAREVSVDFGIHGHNNTVRFLTRITPFLNPALQGFYKMGRAGRERFFTTLLRGSMLAAFSVALYLKNRDKDWYDKLEEWEKNVYWHFDLGLRDDQGKVIPLRLPKPFEWGAVFGSVPEALTKVAIDRNINEFGKSLASIFQNVFAIRAVPTAILVPAEQWANKNTFTGRRIVPEGKEKLDPELQYGPGTSLAAREVGNVTGTSPARIDHLVRSFLGTMGVYGTMLTDQALRMAGNYPESPATSWRRMPVVQAFVHDPDNPNSRYITEFYDLLDKARRAEASYRATWKHESDTGEAADAYLEKHQDSIAIVHAANRTAERMAKLRKRNEDIAASREYTGAEKRRLIIENNEQIQEMAKEMHQQAQP